MNSATEHRTCPNCGAAIPAKAPQGLCPKCLMAAAAVTTDAGHTGGKRPEPPSLERLAAAFPQLEVLEFIGQGGMGAVYKARQKQLDRIVALKVLPPGIGGDPAFAERFTREAKALAKLMHPNIVALFEFGQADGIYYLLMEFVDGVSLGQLLRASRVSAREALAIVPQICDALQYAHDQGIVHRDIKPENILLDRRGRVKVADFGLAKLVGAGAGKEGSLLPAAASQMEDGAHEVTGPTDDLTAAGKIMGTPNYMAPEQAEHPGEVDHRADIYALGVVFYQMLTGELPSKRMEPPSKKVQIDVRLDEVVMRALEKNPELRYQQVSEVKTMVETIVGSVPPPPTPQITEEHATQTQEKIMNKPLTYGITISLVCLATGLAVWLTARNTRNHVARSGAQTSIESPPAANLPGAASTGDINPQSAEKNAAVSAAQAWLSLIDQGDYSASWKEAEPLFQARVTEESWETTMASLREPLGNLLSRKLKSAQRMTALPGAPDGQYVVIQFQTSFANRKAASEIVTVGPKRDGTWKAGGYYIK